MPSNDKRVVKSRRMRWVRNEEDVLVGKPVDLFYKGFLFGYYVRQC
jgi:hypothetical protein